MQKILVTGSAGFIGASLASKLLQEGYVVVGIDNFDNYYDIELKRNRLKALCKGNNFHQHEVSIEDADALEKIVAEFKPDIIVNLAAKAGVRNSVLNPVDYLKTNILGFQNVMHLATKYKCKHFIFASSSSVYGANTKIPYSVKQNTNHQLSPYAVTKKTNELMAHANSALYGLPSTALRFFTVYGPWGRPDMALFKFTRAILNNETIEIYNNGDHLRDFTYIDDVTECITRVVKGEPPEVREEWLSEIDCDSSSSAPWKVYNIGNSNPVKLNEFIIKLEAALKQTAKKNYLEMQMGDVLETHSDMGEFNKIYSYLPDTSIEEGIGKFTKWYKNYYINR